jgi:lipoate-protein ligase B
MPEHTGVWVAGQKVAAIGISVSRWYAAVFLLIECISL